MWSRKFKADFDFTHDYMPWSCPFNSPDSQDSVVDEGIPDLGIPS